MNGYRIAVNIRRDFSEPCHPRPGGCGATGGPGHESSSLMMFVTVAYALLAY